MTHRRPAGGFTVRTRITTAGLAAASGPGTTGVSTAGSPAYGAALDS